MFNFIMAVLRGFGDRIPGSREDAEYDVRELAGELTPEERRAEKLAEQENYNNNIRSSYFWAGSDTWIDSNGNERSF